MSNIAKGMESNFWNSIRKAVDKFNKEIEQFTKDYIAESVEDLKEVLFVLQTYFAILLKMIAAETMTLQHGSLLPSFVERWAIINNTELRNEIEDIETGGIFKRYGISNFLEGDLYSWYIDVWNEEIANVVHDIAIQLSQYETGMIRLEPEASQDLLKRLYQYLIPKSIRHDLGEYYTPDWLAELVLDSVEYNGDPSKRLLDPACGSGTFLILAMKRILQYYDDNPELIPEHELLDYILQNVVGFDINPIAVLAAKTNYLIATAGLSRRNQIEIPVYLCDSVLTPNEYVSLEGKRFQIRTAALDFSIPKALSNKQCIEKILSILEETIGDYTSPHVNVYRERLQKVLPPEEYKQGEKDLVALYEKVASLHSKGQNKIWARIIKNNFAPLYVSKFDYVVGNPPWIRWSYLADDYSQASWNLWEKYGLFAMKGMHAKIGSGELDFSMLFLYASVDCYLKNTGKLAFLITQEVFKSKKAGEGFRRFRIGNNGSFLKVKFVHDLVSLKPFEGAANKTALLALVKGKETEYPVDYYVWSKRSKAKFSNLCH